MKNIINTIKKHYLPIILILGGVIDQTTDLLVQLLSEINAPAWTGTLLRIIVITFGAFKLYISTNTVKAKTENTEG